jgi:hypothetical protein
MRLKLPISAAITISFGLVVLLAYFIELPVLTILRQILLHWAISIAAVALLVGVANLLSVHWQKASAGQKGSFYSLVLILSLLVTILIAGWFGPTSNWALWMFNNLQVPVETSLMAILAVTLAFAGLRLLRKRLNLFSLIFLGAAILMLLGTAPLFGVVIPGLHGQLGLRALITQVPAVAGGRGILIGVALGTIATGLRVLLGAERPYRG